MTPDARSTLALPAAIRLFLAFAFAYFLSALIRAVAATLAPILTQELALTASDLGLLAGGYFLGFSLTQLPLGTWLDRYGPRAVSLAFLSAAVAGCAAFALASGFQSLLAARVLCGAGVSACLMAPLTAYRRWYPDRMQMRANSWMLMTGSLGMLASTLPVQWLLPHTGWRGLFWLLAVAVLVAMVALAWLVPRWPGQAPAASGKPAASPTGTAAPAQQATRATQGSGESARAPTGYRAVWAHPYFRRILPMGFFIYGGMVAFQTLWAGPWMVRVAGFSPLQSATGLFWINLCMLITYATWGFAASRLARSRDEANRLMLWGLPLALVPFAILCIAGEAANSAVVPLFAAFFIGCSFVSLSQAALGLAFPMALAGRALSAYNLAIFAGVFVVQWGVGLAVDAFTAAGAVGSWPFRLAFAGYALSFIGSYLWFAWYRGDNQAAP